MSRMTPPHVTSAIRRAVEVLSQNLGAEDIAENWDEESQQMFLSWMRDLLVRAQQGKYVGDECRSIIRNLDFCGIQGGRLHDSVLGVQDAWLNLS